MDVEKDTSEFEGKKFKELMQMFRILFFDRVAKKQFQNPHTYVQQLQILLKKFASFDIEVKNGLEVIDEFIDNSVLNAEMSGGVVPIRSIKIVHKKVNYTISFAEEKYLVYTSKKEGKKLVGVYEYPANSLVCQYRVSNRFSELESLFVKSKCSMRFSTNTAAKMQQKERPQNNNARKILRLLREHFTSIEGYTYEQGKPSHSWSDTVQRLELPLLSQLFEDAAALLRLEPTLLEVESPAYIIGDLHGNYEDLMKFARFFGMWYLDVVPTKFIFLGDYVDRGPHSVETVAFLLALKVLYPEKVFLLRGNHESNDINADVKTYRDVSLIYQCCSAYDEKVNLSAIHTVATAAAQPGKPAFQKSVVSLIEASSGLTLWNKMNECFNNLPLCCVIDGKIFCVHGGLPRVIANYDGGDFLGEIREIPRPITNVYSSYLLFDLLWADPASIEEERLLNKAIFGGNQRGGETIIFGKNAVARFHALTGCTHILRAHQSPKNGIDIGKDATTLTVFSSSHYCCNTNSAGALLADNNTINIIVFGDGNKTAVDTQVSVPHC